MSKLKNLFNKIKAFLWKLFFGQYRILGYTLLVIALLIIIKGVQIVSIIMSSAKRGAPPATVNTYVVEKRNWPRTIEAVGGLRPKQGASFSAEDNGRVAVVNFLSGSEVQAGQVLLELDSQVEKAQLQAAESDLKLKTINVQRERGLRKQNANAVSDLDQAEAEFAKASAEVKRLQAVIARRQVVAPFDGRVGINKINVGQFVSVGTPLLDLNSNQAFYIDFNIPQEEVKNYQVGDVVEVKVRGLEDRLFVGELSAINSQVDAVARNVMLQASIENVEDMLIPGMFAEVKLVRNEEFPVLVVPLTAISFAPYGNTVYSVAKNSDQPPFDILAHAITLGRRQGDFVEILSGLKEGQEVIASGTFKLFPGVKIFINNQVQPELSENPSVENS